MQKTMGRSITKTGYKMPFFGGMYHMQMMVEFVDLLGHFSLYPTLCPSATLRAGNFVDSFNFIKKGNLDGMGKDAFTERLYHLKNNKLLQFSTGIKNYFQSAKTFLNSTTESSAMPLFLLEASLGQFRTVSQHETTNIFAKGNLCSNSVSSSHPLKSFKFKPVGGDEGEEADNCKDFAIKSVPGQLVTISDFACAVLDPRKKIDPDSDLGKTRANVIELLDNSEHLKVFQHLPADLEVTMASAAAQKESQVEEGQAENSGESRPKRTGQAVVRYGEDEAQNEEEETGSKSSKSSLKRKKAPSKAESIATNAQTLLPLFGEIQKLCSKKPSKKERSKLMDLLFQHASAITSTNITDAESFESIVKEAASKSSKKSSTAASTVSSSSTKKQSGKKQQQNSKGLKKDDIVKELKEYKTTQISESNSFDILTEGVSTDDIKLEFDLPLGVEFEMTRKVTGQIIVVSTTFSEKEMLWNHFRGDKSEVTGESKKLLTILENSIVNGWKCSLKISKQHNSANELIILMTDKLYNELSAEPPEMSLLDEPTDKSASGSQEEEMVDADAAATAKKSNESMTDSNEASAADEEMKEPETGKVKKSRKRKVSSIDEVIEASSVDDVVEAKDDDSIPPKKKVKKAAEKRNRGRKQNERNDDEDSPQKKATPKKQGKTSKSTSPNASSPQKAAAGESEPATSGTSRSRSPHRTLRQLEAVDYKNSGSATKKK